MKRFQGLTQKYDKLLELIVYLIIAIFASIINIAEFKSKLEKITAENKRLKINISNLTEVNRSVIDQESGQEYFDAQDGRRGTSPDTGRNIGRIHRSAAYRYRVRSNARASKCLGRDRLHNHDRT